MEHLGPRHQVPRFKAVRLRIYRANTLEHHMEIELEEYIKMLQFSLQSAEQPIESESHISEWLNQQCILYYTEGYTSGYRLMPITVEVYSESTRNNREKSINL
jgi:hypothetical protein